MSIITTKKRKRLSFGTLVVSTNPLLNIFAKRTILRVGYSTDGFYNKIINENVIGIRTSLEQ